ncbi:virulence RhuM family protein [Butyricimonas sp. RTP31023st2_F12_RTP31023_210422]|uniref:virulence RhuM family protein n=1 Tax=Butyricimonas sp. RTP31023st2_F12_RTP31023_210422 TaxID=3143211 RepID=UPI0034A56A95
MSQEIQFILYNLPDENGKVQVIIRDETLWCTQKAMAQLFGVDRTVISKHLKNIFDSSELQQDSVCAKIAHTAEDGKTYNTQFYNLDAIISVGYRVNSLQATRFRQWATKILNEYIKKGFVLDDDRLKQGKTIFGVDYFRELLERVRSIRASERRIWQKITDIYAECCIDYDKNSPTTHDFYAMIQNRFHYAITGQTAAEIIYHKADHTKGHMGLTTWKNSPDGRILKSDVSIAKNYLQEKEIRQLERAVTSYFDYIEIQIERQNAFTMEQFAASVNKFLTFNDYRILPDKGRISAAQAKAKAEQEYDIFNRTQPIDSDFDKQIKGMLE